MSDLMMAMVGVAAVSVVVATGVLSVSAEAPSARPREEASSPVERRASARGEAPSDRTGPRATRFVPGVTAGLGALDAETLDRWATRARVRVESRPTTAERVTLARSRVEERRDDVQARLDELDEDLRVVAGDVEGVDPSAVEAALEELDDQIDELETVLSQLSRLDRTLESGRVAVVERWLEADDERDRRHG